MARRRSSKKMGSVVLGAVKVCKVKGKKLVCKTMKPARRKSSRKLGSVVLGAACRSAKGKFKKC
jgi:hypothetical protein